MPTCVPTGGELERSWGILQAVGKADLIARTTEIKGRVRFLARIRERHLRNQKLVKVWSICWVTLLQNQPEINLRKIEDTEIAVNLR